MMGFKTTRLLAICLGLAASASAQDQGLDIGFRVRGGSVFKHTTNMGAGHVNFGAGAEVTYHLNKDQAIFGELFTTYYKADDYRFPMPAQGYVKPGDTTTKPLYPNVSGDRRKDNVEGIGLQLGYRAPLGAGWTWQGGLVITRLTSTQEVTGLLAAGASSVDPAVHEALYFTPKTTKVSPGAFIGARFALVEGVALDINLVNVGFSRINYLPYTYTGRPATTETLNERKTSLELGLVMRF